MIWVHGLNSPNPTKTYDGWKNTIPESNQFDILPVKWKSKNWNEDLFNIYMSKIYRDAQIQKVIDAVKQTNGIPTLWISHSWGTVWSYKAWKRLSAANELKAPIWIVLVGAALGGTNLPFGGIYVEQVKKEYTGSPSPKELERMINIYNNDDYVSSRVFIDRLENMRVDPGGFHPGFQEHDAKIYFKTMEFRMIMQQFMEKFGGNFINS